MDSSRQASVLLGMPGDMLAADDPGDLFSTKVGGQPIFPGLTQPPLGTSLQCRVCSGHLSLVLQAGRHTCTSGQQRLRPLHAFLLHGFACMQKQDACAAALYTRDHAHPVGPIILYQHHSPVHNLHGSISINLT